MLNLGSFHFKKIEDNLFSLELRRTNTESRLIGEARITTDESIDETEFHQLIFRNGNSLSHRNIKFQSLEPELQKALNIRDCDVPTKECAKKISTYVEMLLRFQKGVHQLLHQVPKDLRTYEMCLAGVSVAGWTITSVPLEILSEEICLQAVMNCGRALETIPERFKTHEVCLAAVNQDPFSLQFIPKEITSQAIYVAAAKKNGLAINLIPSEFRTQEVCLAALESPKAYGANLGEIVSDFPADLHFTKEFTLSEFPKIYTKSPIKFGEIIQSIPSLNVFRNEIVHKACEESPIPPELSHQILRYRNAPTQDWLISLALGSERISSAKFREMVIDSTKSSSLLPVFVAYYFLIRAHQDSSKEFEALKEVFHQHRKALKDHTTNLLRIILDFQKTLYESKCFAGEKFHALGKCMIGDYNLGELKIRTSIFTYFLKKEPLIIPHLQERTPTHILLDRVAKELAEHGIIDNTIPDYKKSFCLKFILEHRNPDALFAYTQRFLQNPKIAQFIKIFISSVLEERFTEFRNINNSHRRYLSREQLAIWETGSEAKLLNPAASQASAFDAKLFLRQKLIHDAHAPELIPLLKLVEDNDPSIESEEDNSILKALAKLYVADSTNLLSSLTQLKKLIEGDTDLQQSQFMLDLNDAISLATPHLSARQNLTIVDSDDHQDYLLCGTDVPGSCQTVYGVSFYNKCLMGYILDGKIRLLAIKNPTGKIEARAILKVLVDENNQPALFFERPYPNNTYREPLAKLALEKAEAMGIPLFVSRNEKEGEITTLYSERNFIGFEYEDGAQDGHGVTNGKFSVAAVRL